MESFCFFFFFLSLLLPFFEFQANSEKWEESSCFCHGRKTEKQRVEQRKKKRLGMNLNGGCTSFIVAWMVRIAWIKNHPTAGVNTGGL